jgi:hypothetical protein
MGDDIARPIPVVLILEQQCRYPGNLLAALDSYRLPAQMNKRFVVIQTPKVSLIGLQKRLCDDMFYVWLRISPEPVQSIPERICHATHYRLPCFSLTAF